jgi:phosphoribosylformylglycinamidine (FGAM) synthase PurS component
MCRKLLANPVLEDYTIETVEGASLEATSALR